MSMGHSWLWLQVAMSMMLVHLTVIAIRTEATQICIYTALCTGRN